ncbi:MAG: GMC family oxidoreductase N-terminal domain-containing protein [Chloroflexi bacterium]|nr:GMC family oxidoreductase N-terminal domain-containing protein [Chloroflexota bacterium]
MERASGRIGTGQRFGGGEIATVATLAETFAPGADAGQLAALATEALVRAADPAQVGQLRLVLRLLENGTLNLLGGGPFLGLSSMAPADRERLLLRWAHSPIALKRSAFQALRKLLSFLAYAAPAPDGSAANPLLAAIGYEPDAAPETSDRTPLRPLELDRSPADAPVTLVADVIVVGSGAGGGVVAAELAAAGRAVLVLEAGPFVDEASMPRTELEAFSRLYLNHGLLSTWDASVSFLAGSAVGGGTLVNWMTCIDVPDPVRREWVRDHGLDGVDGPEWVADRAAIEAEIGVAVCLAAPPKDAAILRGAAALGWEAAPIRRNAAGCSDCGSCPFGCPWGAKYSGIRAHLVTAAAGGARVVDRVRVTRLLLEGGVVTGVEGNLLVTDPATGLPVLAAAGDPTSVRVRRLVARAPQVVLAAGALRTPAIVQASGVAHRAAGRHLRIHPVPVVAARMAEPVAMWRGIMQAARSAEFIDAGAGRHGYVMESAPGHPGLMALAVPWDGAADHAAWMAGARFLAPLVAVTRDGGEGRTTLTRAGRVRIDYRLDASGVATLRHALGSMARIARAAGAVEILAAATPIVRHDTRGSREGERFDAFLGRLASMDFAPNRGSVFSAHQMGTLRMGADAGDHAADPGGRVRGPDGAVIAGLYVADTSTFPTGIGVNPMLAVMTMAKRVARTIRAEGRASG